MTRPNENLISIAKSWLRTPYHHRQACKGAGVDCAHLLIEVYAEAGMLERFSPGEYPIDYMFHSKDDQFLQNVLCWADEVEGDPMPGDLAMYKFGHVYSHGAIVVDWPTIIHASRPDGCVVIGDGTGGHLGDAKRDVRFFRMKGML